MPSTIDTTTPPRPPAVADTPAGARATRVIDGEGTLVCAHCATADTFGRRLRGLMGRAEMSAGEGLLIRPSSSVHTCFMRFAIDVVFLDANDRVLRIAPNLGPWRAAAARGAKAVLELPAGHAARTGLIEGAHLHFHDVHDLLDNGADQ